LNFENAALLWIQKGEMLLIQQWISNQYQWKEAGSTFNLKKKKKLSDFHKVLLPFIQGRFANEAGGPLPREALIKNESD